jgi:hypothetical protein
VSATLPLAQADTPLPAARRDIAAAAAGAGRHAGRAALHQPADLGDPDRRRPRHGHDDVHHGQRPDPRVRPDERAELRPRRLHLGRRLCRHHCADADARLARSRFAGRQPRRAGAGRHGRDGGHGPDRLGLRAHRHHAGLRPAPEADPDHHGRHDRLGTADQRDLGRRADPAADADHAARRHLPGRRGDREIPAAGGRRRAGGVPCHVPGAEPHEDRPADPRRRRERRDGRSHGLPHPPPVRRRVRGRFGAGRPGRRDVGPVQGNAGGAHGQRSDGAGLHRHHHRRPRLGRRLLHRRAADGPGQPTMPASCCRSSRWSRTSC